MKKHHHQKGFSLIEIAIVLVIIGILAGAVVKGLALIDDARLSKAQQAIQSISTAYFTYLRLYSAPPGDDSAADTRFNLSSSNGDGNAIISAAEGKNAWLHLRKAGLLTGAGSAIPLHPWGGAYALVNNLQLSRNALCLNALQGNQALVLDNSLDDGLPNSGTMRTDKDTDTAYNPSKSYNLCTAL